MERPEFCEDRHLDFFDTMRESGKINMLGAAPELARVTELTPEQARAVHRYWVATFSERHRAPQEAQ